MKQQLFIYLLIVAAFLTGSSRLVAQQNASPMEIDFCGQKVSFVGQKLPPDAFDKHLSIDGVIHFYTTILQSNYADVIASLKKYRETNKPDDWLFYQLIRRTAQQISPKELNYFQYTMFKWYFLQSTGYDAMIRVSQNKMLFYVQCDENIYNIPNVVKNKKQFVCLNYHDYGTIDFISESFADATLPCSADSRTFSYKVTSIPDFKTTEYLEKDIHFTYNENDYHFRVKLSPNTLNLFNNYPVVDYESNFNIPLSKETYNSLIPQLKKNVRGLKVRSGVDYLMRFTRYAFLFESDKKNFGGEKRLSPEQTLFYDRSDCEDRVALFFYLVKEIYDLPMIILSYPSHVTIAVEFDKPVGLPITYKGKTYSVCEPTPQQQDLAIGQSMPDLANTPYQVSYEYRPSNKK